jgi:Myotubularin-like phosphatase domain
LLLFSRFLQFAQRHGHGDKNYGDSQRSPVFLQFIDCTWQLMQQFPSSFEFSSELLLCIVEEMFAGRFGTFLYNSDRDRRRPPDQREDVTRSTVSLWTMVLQDHAENGINSTFANVMYHGHSDVLIPIVSMKNIQVWHPFFFCYSPVRDFLFCFVLFFCMYRWPSANPKLLQELRIHTQTDMLEAKVRAQQARLEELEREVELLRKT